MSSQLKSIPDAYFAGLPESAARVYGEGSLVCEDQTLQYRLNPVTRPVVPLLRGAADIPSSLDNLKQGIAVLNNVALGAVERGLHAVGQFAFAGVNL